MASIASDFQKIITDARERKKNANLAEQIFGRGRRQERSAATAGGLIRNNSSSNTHHVSGRWTHDLRISVNGAGPARSRSLSARITTSG
ncbi:hypothetical protein E4U41_001764, partial [Claviceps citrina]